jgi:hypothetical protein
MPQLPPNPRLRQLEALVGEWELSVPQFGGAGGRASIGWMEQGAYLRILSTAPEPAPSAVQIVGSDDDNDDYCTVSYYDSRGVSRIYRMSFAERRWRIWREAPGFWQRFSGTLSEDGREIRGAWEKSPDDGGTWELDFDLIYTRVS